MSKIISYLVIVPLMFILLIKSVTVFEFTIKQRYIKDCIDNTCDKVKITGVFTNSDLSEFANELKKFSSFDSLSKPQNRNFLDFYKFLFLNKLTARLQNQKTGRRKKQWNRCSGVSMGGYTAWQVAMSRPEWFATMDGWKDIEWPLPEVTIEIINQELIKGEWQTKVKVKANGFVRLFHILYTGEDQEVFFSDNYFDMSKGYEHMLYISSICKIGLNDLQTGHWMTEWE